MCDSDRLMYNILYFKMIYIVFSKNQIHITSKRKTETRIIFYSYN